MTDPKLRPLLAQLVSVLSTMVVATTFPAPPLAATRQSALLPGMITVLPSPVPAKPVA